MRDQLEEALRHSNDGIGRVHAQDRAALPKRFYKQAGYRAEDDGWQVTLDDRPAKTPGRKPLAVASESIAAAMAAEWSAQGETIDPRSMPVTRLINSAIEGGAERAPALRDEIVKYCGTDLLLYRAGYPSDLVAAQEASWDPILTALARHFGVAFQPTIGITHQPQPESTLQKLAASLSDENHFVLAAMVSITGITGSGLLAIALRSGLIEAAQALTAAHVDEDHNIARWGEDPEAVERRARRVADFETAVLVIEALA